MLLTDSTEARRTRETQSQQGQLHCVAVRHLQVLWSSSLGAIQQVAFQHLVKYFVRNSLLFHRAGSFQKMGEGVLELRTKDPHAIYIRNGALLSVLEEVVLA